jgi:hypothetical protein
MGNPPQPPQPAPATGGGINRNDLRALGFVAFAGAVGGLLYWVLAELAQQPVGSNWSVSEQIFAMVFVGAIAGLFGVYLLTASDLKAIKTFIFAIVCGLVWQPILQSAQGLVATATATKQAADLGTRATQIKASAKTGNASQLKSQLNSTAAAVNDAVTTLPSVTDKDKRRELLSQSKNAVDAIESGFSAAPTATVDALTDVGLKSAKANQGEVAATTIQSLAAVANTAQKKGQDDVARKAYQSIRSISSYSSDPLVKGTAANAMKATEVAIPAPAAPVPH